MSAGRQAASDPGYLEACFGKQPLNGQVSAYYNAEKPDSGADWQLRLQLQFLFPK